MRVPLSSTIFRCCSQMPVTVWKNFYKSSSKSHSSHLKKVPLLSLRRYGNWGMDWLRNVFLQCQDLYGKELGWSDLWLQAKCALTFNCLSIDSSHNNSEAMGINYPTLKMRELAFREIKEVFKNSCQSASEKRDCLLSPPVSGGQP